MPFPFLSKSYGMEDQNKATSIASKPKDGECGDYKCMECNGQVDDWQWVWASRVTPRGKQKRPVSMPVTGIEQRARE
jgi:hypothetical protein